MASKSDQARYRKLFDYGCVCCRLLDGRYSLPQMHHLVDRGTRAASGGNSATLPLCPWHHQGIPGMFGKNATRQVMGPSLADGSKPFNARWGTQRDLLALVAKQIHSARNTGVAREP